MSTLTKVFVLLVSVLAILLSGIVATFVINTNNWKAIAEEQERLAKAAQVTAAVAEQAYARGIAKRDNIIQMQNNTLRMQEAANAETQRQRETEAQSRALAENESFTAVALAQSLRETIQNMYAAQNAIQADLDETHRKTLTAQSQVVQLTRELNGERVQNDQLKSISRQRLEKIHELEDELTTKSQEVALKPKDWDEKGDQLSQVPVRESGVPIRGQITAVDNDLASISVGSASGVRKNMKFLVYRDNQYLGDLLVTHVESGESAGRIDIRKGAIVKGDSVTTGFN